MQDEYKKFDSHEEQANSQFEEVYVVPNIVTVNIESTNFPSHCPLVLDLVSSGSAAVADNTGRGVWQGFCGRGRQRRLQQCGGVVCCCCN